MPSGEALSAECQIHSSYASTLGNEEKKIMNKAELKPLNELLKEECGWLVEVGVSPGSGEEFFCVYEACPDTDTDTDININAERPQASATRLHSEPTRGAFVGVMPICTTLAALVSSGALCQYYYQKGLSARRNTPS